MQPAQTEKLEALASVIVPSPSSPPRGPGGGGGSSGSCGHSSGSRGGGGSSSGSRGPSSAPSGGGSATATPASCGIRPGTGGACCATPTGTCDAPTSATFPSNSHQHCSAPWRRGRARGFSITGTGGGLCCWCTAKVLYPALGCRLCHPCSATARSDNSRSSGYGNPLGEGVCVPDGWRRRRESGTVSGSSGTGICKHRPQSSALGRLPPCTFPAANAPRSGRH